MKSSCGETERHGGASERLRQQHARRRVWRWVGGRVGGGPAERTDWWLMTSRAQAGRAGWRPPLPAGTARCARWGALRQPCHARADVVPRCCCCRPAAALQLLRRNNSCWCWRWRRRAAAPLLLPSRRCAAQAAHRRRVDVKLLGAAGHVVGVQQLVGLEGSRAGRRQHRCAVGTPGRRAGAGMLSGCAVAHSPAGQPAGGVG